METPLNEGFVLSILKQASLGCTKSEIIDNARNCWSAQVKQKDVGKHIAEAKRRGMYSVAGMAYGDTYYQYEPENTSKAPESVNKQKHITLGEAKELWASQFNKTWAKVQQDMDYGNGVSTMYDWEAILDRVAEIYKTGKL